MRTFGNRTVHVKKADLIKTIKENKENHIKEYDKAVMAYKEEALRQLADLTNKVEKGALDIKLKLIKPIDNRDNYDKIVQMFEWEVNDIVELQQDEFKEYVQDETNESIEAKFSNSAYFKQ